MKNSLFKNSVYNTVGGVARIGLGILTIPVLIRHLSIEEYGLWSLVSATISILVLAEAGLSTATTVFIAEDLKSEDLKSLSETLSVTIILMLTTATACAVLLWISADRFTSLFPQLHPSQQLSASKGLQFGAVGLWSRLMQQVLIGIEQAYHQYKSINLVGTLQSILIGLGLIMIAFSGGKTVELMQWQSLSCSLILICHIWIVTSLLKDISLKILWDSKKALKIGKYGAVVWVSSLGGVLFSKVDRLIVGNMLGSSALGVYSAITDITSQINVISALPVQPLVPFLSQQRLENEASRQDLTGKIKQFMEINTFVALILGGSLTALAPILIQFILPQHSTHEYVAIFQIASIIYSLYSINAVAYFVLLGIKSASVCATIQILVGISSLLWIAFGAHHLGLYGAVLANSSCISIFALTFISMNRLSISHLLWIRWISFPMLVFILFTVVNLFVNTSIFMSVFLCVTQAAILLGWFLKQQGRILIW